MDYTGFERQIIAYCLLYPSLLDGLYSDLIYAVDNQLILKTAKKLKTDNNNRITFTNYETAVSSGWPNTSFSQYSLEKVYDIFYGSQDLPEKEIKTEFNNVIHILQKRHKKKGLLEQLELAKEMIVEDKENDAVALVKSIRFDRPEKLLTTRQYMLSSILETNGFPTGISVFDNNGGLTRGNLFGIIGDTGAQKTMVSLWLCVKFLIANPTFRCVYFEKEMAIKDLARRMVSHLTKVTSDEIMKVAIERDESIRGNEWMRIAASIDTEMDKETIISDAFNRIQLVPNTHFNTITDMHRIIDYEKPEIWCLDFMTTLAVDFKSSKDGYNMAIVEAFDGLKNIVQDSESLGIVLNQLNHNTVQRRQSKIPMTSDIEWGKRVKDLCAYVYATFWPAMYMKIKERDRFYLVGLKHRNTGNFTVCLKTVPELNSYEELKTTEYERAMQWLDDYQKRYEK